MLIIDSENLLELSINLGNAARELDINVGDPVEIKLE